MPFQKAVGDTNWIHFDPARAADTPFGRVLVPGFYLISLAERYLPDNLAGFKIKFRLDIGITDLAKLVPESRGSHMIGRWVRQRESIDEDAIILEKLVAASDSVPEGFGKPSTYSISASTLEKLYGKSHETLPLGVTTALLATALREHATSQGDDEPIGAYRNVTITVNRSARVNVPLSVYVRQVKQKGDLLNLGYQLTQGGESVIQGRCKILQLQTATHK